MLCFFCHRNAGIFHFFRAFLSDGIGFRAFCAFFKSQFFCVFHKAFDSRAARKINCVRSVFNKVFQCFVVAVKLDYRGLVNGKSIDDSPSFSSKILDTALSFKFPVTYRIFRCSIVS